MGRFQHHRLLRWHHPSASHFRFPGAGQQPHTSRQCSCWVSLQDWESPLTPLPPNLLPQAVRTPMYVGGRVLEAETITASLPVAQKERERGPPSGRPVSRRLIRWVSTPLGCLAMSPQLPTPESTPPQHGGGARAPPKDPLKNVANYKSTGWSKDLEHVIKAYYKHNFTSFKEAEWAKLKDKFFEHLIQRQDEWRSIKENHPLQYMPYMEKHFHAATGIKLKGLSDFTGWIKHGSDYHAVVARKGQLHKCPHLAGVELPRWSQVTPSESHQVSQRREETPTTGPHMLSKKASVAQGARSDVPAPMETGGAGDGWSWADQAEASTDDEFRRDRPTKRRRSASRRREGLPTLPFRLQDNNGRCASVQQLYQHAGERPLARHKVATLGMTHQYPDMEPHEARSLSNQVLCMIAEYHLTGLPEVAKDLLPPIEDYLAGGEFQGMRDVRVVERAKTLQIAAWLHRLDMAADGDETASFSLEVARHGRGPLLDLLLAPMTSSLTFAEVVQCVLAKIRHRGTRGTVLSSREMTETRERESVKSSRKKIKKEIDLRRKDLESLRVAISQHESSLGWDQPEKTTTSDDGSSDNGAGDAEEAEMAITPVAEDAPPVSARTPPPNPPPVEEQTHPMEVDDGQPPASPISPREDELLTGSGALGVEGEMANLKVSSPRGQDGGDVDASI